MLLFVSKFLSWFLSLSDLTPPTWWAFWLCTWLKPPFSACVQVEQGRSPALPLKISISPERMRAAIVYLRSKGAGRPTCLPDSQDDFPFVQNPSGCASIREASPPVRRPARCGRPVALPPPVLACSLLYIPPWGLRGLSTPSSPKKYKNKT